MCMCFLWKKRKNHCSIHVRMTYIEWKKKKKKKMGKGKKKKRKEKKKSS